MLAKIIKYRVGLATTAAILLACVVAGFTGYGSWGHIVGVATKYGEQAAPYLPVSIDGMMLAGAALAAADRMRGFRPRIWASICLWSGALMTLAFNAMSAWDRGPIAVGIALTPAIGLLFTVEAIFRGARKLLVTLEAYAATMAQSQPQPVESVATAPTTVEVPEVPTTAVPAASESLDGRTTPPSPRLTKPRARPRRKPVVDTVTIEAVDNDATVAVG